MANTASMGRIAPAPKPRNFDPVALHGDAHNALAMALHYLRQPGDANVAGATRKAVQALAALRRLNVPAGDIQNPSTTARG